MLNNRRKLRGVVMIAKYKNRVFPSGMVGLKRVRVEFPDPRHTIEFDSLSGLKNWD